MRKSYYIEKKHSKYRSFSLNPSASHFTEANFFMEDPSEVRVNRMTSIKHVYEMRWWTSWRCKCRKWVKTLILLENKNKAQKLFWKSVGSPHAHPLIQAGGPPGFECPLCGTCRNAWVTNVPHVWVEHAYVAKRRFGNVLRDVIVIRLFNFLTLNY